MATSNPVLSPAWSLLVDAGDEFLLTFPADTLDEIEIATLDAAPIAPATPETALAGVRGHRLSAAQQESINRALIGPGPVYGRALRDSVFVTLNAWTTW